MCEYRRVPQFFAAGIALFFSMLSTAHSAENLLTTRTFYSAATCASSSCHGGATEKSCQLIIWSTQDIHSRSYATLTTARSARMAEALKIASAVESSRCTVCHAPLAAVAIPTEKTPGLIGNFATESVSCVSCHGPADAWIRTHTRPDYSHAERVAAGMKDLHSSYIRANTCVACHQNIDPELVSRARHPELIFELDGQAASQPKHWKETSGWSGAQTWYVGQLVALREVSWGLANKTISAEQETPRYRALAWLTARAAGTTATIGSDFAAAVNAADALARSASAETWTPTRAAEALRRVSATVADFRDSAVPQAEQARRAEALVLALDRLLLAHSAAARSTAASAALNKLFTLAQSRPDFAPAAFAQALEDFSRTLPPG